MTDATELKRLRALLKRHQPDAAFGQYSNNEGYCRYMDGGYRYTIWRKSELEAIRSVLRLLGIEDTI